MTGPSSREAGARRPGVVVTFGSVALLTIRPGAVRAAALAALLALASGARGQEPGTGSAAACPSPDSLTVGFEPPLAAVRYLADDALRGRLAGSPGARCAAEYIADRLGRLGLEPGGEKGSWFGPVPLRSALNPHAPEGSGRNVIGVLPGSDPELSGEAVVIGAHYDHVGLGGFGSVDPGDAGQVHNGADDNASGVAALLGAAERLVSEPRPARSVVFVAFTGEELGLLGSSAYTEEPAVPLRRTRAMLNMDMVGRLGADPLIVNGVGTAAEWEEIVRSASRRTGVEVRVGEEGFGPSDHSSFYARGVPVLHLFTNVHGDYHRPGDDWWKVDARGIERVAELAARLARRVADRSGPLTYREGTAPPHARGEGEGYGAYLGTIPDFTPVDHGVRISGVNAGSPADEAGLEGGDVIVGIGEHEVADLRAMTEALRAHEPGDTVQVRFLRGGEERRATAVLGDRDARGR